MVVGLTGFEPVTLRLSSACSNQLSYRPMLSFVDSILTILDFLGTVLWSEAKLNEAPRRLYSQSHCKH